MWRINRFLYKLPNRTFAKTHKDNRIARLVDLNAIIDDLNGILEEIEVAIAAGGGGLTPGQDIEVCDITLTPITATLGPLVNFYTAGGGTDPIIPGALEITRNSDNSIWNRVLEGDGFSNFPNSPLNTEWNADGWGTLEDIKSRTYSTFWGVTNDGFNYVPLGKELIMHDLVSDRYWKIEFTDFNVGARTGEFGWNREEIFVTDPCVITFSDGTSINTAPVIPADLNTWDITGAAFVDPINGVNGTAVIGDGNLPYRDVAAALGASDFVILKAGNYNVSVSVSGDNKHIHAMGGVNFQNGGFTIFSTVTNFRLSGSAIFTGFSCTVLQLFNITDAEIDFEFDYADNVRWITSNASNASNVIRMNANWATCHAFNGAAHAIRLWGDTDYYYTFKHYFHSQHVVAFARNGWTGRCVFNCPEIRTVANYTSNYGNTSKYPFGMDLTNGAYLEVNGDQYNDHPTYAFGTVAGFYWENQINGGAGATEVVMNGDMYVEEGFGIFGQYRSAYGDFTLNGNLTCNRNAFYSELSGWGTPADQRYTFNGSVITTGSHMLPGRGKYYYFRDCSFYNTLAVASGGENLFTPLEPGSPVSQTYLYFYNCVLEAAGVGVGAVTFNAWSPNFTIGTINTHSNAALGPAPAVDTWGGFVLQPLLEVPKLS